MLGKKELGKLGEDQAAQFLINQGYKIVARNWRWKRAEVDIIAEDNDMLVFCEVKTRTQIFLGPPEAFVTDAQLDRLAHLAQVYLVEHELDKDARIDILALVYVHGEFAVEHFKDVYYPEGN